MTLRHQHKDSIDTFNEGSKSVDQKDRKKVEGLCKIILIHMMDKRMRNDCIVNVL